MAIGQLTMQQLDILHCTFWFYNCTSCDQLHVKICPASNGSTFGANEYDDEEAEELPSW